MEIPALEVWLKTSIPGIILLGAVGSIVAAFCIWAAARLLLPLAKKTVVGSLKKLIRHFVIPAATELTRLHFIKGENKVHVFYTFQIMKLVFYLFIATCGFVLFTTALPQSAPTLVRTSVLLPLIVFFLAVWYALRCLAVALVPLYTDIDKLIEESEAMKKLEKKQS